MTKKVLSLILAVLMLLPMAVACAETANEGSNTSAEAQITTAPGGADGTAEPEETEL